MVYSVYIYDIFIMVINGVYIIIYIYIHIIICVYNNYVYIYIIHEFSVATKQSVYELLLNVCFLIFF